MLDALLATPAATAAGLIAFVCLSVWPLFRSRSSILLVQLGASVAFATHYGLLGFMAPAAVNVLGSGQTVAALFAPNSPALNRIGYILVGLMAAAGIYFWIGPVSALCIIAMGLIAVGRMQKNQIALRSLILAGGAFWLAHDYLVGSYIALGADVTSLTIGLASLHLLSKYRLSPLSVGEALRVVQAVLTEAFDCATAPLRLDLVTLKGRRVPAPIPSRRDQVDQSRPRGPR